MSSTVELLWEDGDPSQALTERFGFADADAAGRWVAATVTGAGVRRTAVAPGS